MESKQLGPGFAAEILGVDLSAAMSDGDFDAIKKVWSFAMRTNLFAVHGTLRTTFRARDSTTRPGLASC